MRRLYLLDLERDRLAEPVSTSADRALAPPFLQRSPNLIADYRRTPANDVQAHAQSLLFQVLTQIDLRRDRVIQDILRPFNLGVSQARALICLGVRPNGAAMTELADLLVIDRTSLTRIMDKLVAAGLVERSEPEHDRRITQIALTEAGEGVWQALTELLEDHSRRLLEGVAGEDVDCANRVLAAILERLVGRKAGAQGLMGLL
jgi:DNA-binding MarR family transcriptional regulator